MDRTRINRRDQFVGTAAAVAGFLEGSGVQTPVEANPSVGTLLQEKSWICL
jgi:hypothetical protein